MLPPAVVPVRQLQSLTQDLGDNDQDVSLNPLFPNL